MKHYKKTIMTLLIAAILLTATFMTKCTKLTEASNNTHSEIDAPVESDGLAYMSSWNAAMLALSPCTVVVSQRYVKMQTAHC